MDIKYYTTSELKNMSFPTTWFTNNREKIQKKQFNQYLSIPIIANIEGKKVTHILSEFEYIGSRFLQEDNNKPIPCIYYPNLSKEDAIELLVAQSDRNSSMDVIRKELELLTADEKKYYQYYHAFNIERIEYLKEVNVKYEGRMRKITEKSLISIYEKCKLESLFKPLNLELSKQAEILCDYVKRMIEIIDDDAIIPKAPMFRYLWSIYEAIFELMVHEQISFSSPDFDELLNNIYELVLKDDLTKIVDSFVAEQNIYSVANKHKADIRLLQKTPITFNPFAI